METSHAGRGHCASGEGSVVMSLFSARDARSIRGPDGVLLVLRVTSVLACLAVLYQAAAAGEVFTRNQIAGELYTAGAVVLYVLTGLTAISAFVHRRVGAAPWWPTVVAAAVFASSFLRILVGPQSTLYVHVPLVLAFMTGTTVVATWALTARPSPVAD